MGKLSPGERRTCAFSFLLLFLLMASYYVMRPFRDALASDWSDVEVSALWTLNFFVSLGFVACYGWLVATMRLKTLVPSVYLFFALSFLLFYLGLTEGWLKKAFYVWVSVFSLFHLSVFWSFMSDIYSEEQAKRLFSIIGAGASAGALIGPAIPTFFAQKVGVDHLLLLSICLL